MQVCFYVLRLNSCQILCAIYCLVLMCFLNSLFRYLLALHWFHFSSFTYIALFINLYNDFSSLKWFMWFLRLDLLCLRDIIGSKIVKNYIKYLFRRLVFTSNYRESTVNCGDYKLKIKFWFGCIYLENYVGRFLFFLNFINQIFKLRF